MKTIIGDNDPLYREYKPMLCHCCGAPMTSKIQCDYCGVRYDIHESKEDNGTTPNTDDDNRYSYTKMFCNVPSLMGKDWLKLKQ